MSVRKEFWILARIFTLAEDGYYSLKSYPLPAQSRSGDRNKIFQPNVNSWAPGFGILFKWLIPRFLVVSLNLDQKRRRVTRHVFHLRELVRVGWGQLALTALTCRACFILVIYFTWFILYAGFRVLYKSMLSIFYYIHTRETNVLFSEVPFTLKRIGTE